MKAFQVRILTSWLNFELNEILENEEADFGVLTIPMAVGAYALANFYHCLDVMPRLLSEEQSREMADHLEFVLACFLCAFSLIRRIGALTLQHQAQVPPDGTHD